MYFMYMCKHWYLLNELDKGDLWIYNHDNLILLLSLHIYSVLTASTSLVMQVFDYCAEKNSNKTILELFYNWYKQNNYQTQ